MKILLVLLEVFHCLFRLASVQHLIQQSELGALQVLGTVQETLGLLLYLLALLGVARVLLRSLQLGLSEQVADFGLVYERWLRVVFSSQLTKHSLAEIK